MDVPGRSLDAAPTDIVPAEVAHGGDASRHATACSLRVAGGRPRGGDAHKRYAGSCMYGSTMQTHTHTMHFPTLEHPNLSSILVPGVVDRWAVDRWLHKYCLYSFPMKVKTRKAFKRSQGIPRDVCNSIYLVFASVTRPCMVSAEIHAQ